MRPSIQYCLKIVFAAIVTTGASVVAQPPDLIVHHGQIVTVDAEFRIAEAMAIHGDRIQSLGGNEEILKLAGPDTLQMETRAEP